MAQHLRIGSVIEIGTGTTGTVTNITNEYIEYETNTTPPVVWVRSWAAVASYKVVTD